MNILEEILCEFESLLEALITSKDNIIGLKVAIHYNQRVDQICQLLNKDFSSEKINPQELSFEQLKNNREEYTDNSGCGFYFESTATAQTVPQIDLEKSYCEKIIFETRLRTLIKKLKDLLKNYGTTTATIADKSSGQ